jgi:NAD(P)-dependent dehydrogenase (short-subunit alcohol dehydrogenase family)
MDDPVRAPLLNRKVAIVTGGASGIGKACARAMAREGASIAIFDSCAESGREVADELAAQAYTAAFFEVDVACEASVRAAIAAVIHRFERLDILHNNAGIAIRQPVDSQDEEGWQRCMDVNLKGVFLCSKHAIPHMREQGGSIVNTSSVTGITGVRNRAAYSATKGAIVALTRNMALDYARYGIRVNCVCPGFTRTPLAEALLRDPDRERRLIGMHPLGRLGEPEDIANAVVFLVSGLASWITGQVVAVDGGFSAGPSEDI